MGSVYNDIRGSLKGKAEHVRAILSSQPLMKLTGNVNSLKISVKYVKVKGSHSVGNTQQQCCFSNASCANHD